MKKLAVALAICIALVALPGCKAGFSADEEIANRQELGESSSIEFAFQFLFGIYDWGPYEIEYTPEGVVNLEVNGRSVDCVKLRLRVLSTDDGEPAEYANCVSPVSLLTENMKDVAYDVWYTDESGTPADVHGKLDIGKDYVFYIPLREPFEQSNLHYVAISDLSGYYNRSGQTYWYEL